MKNKYAEFREKTQDKKLLAAADCVVLKLVDNRIKVLLVKRKKEPKKGGWALPGGFLEKNEDLEGCAKRELWEETGLKKANYNYFGLVGVFSSPRRDPRARVISSAYLVLLGKEKKQKLKAGTDATEAKWFSWDNLPELSFGSAHKRILKVAKIKLIEKIQTTNLIFAFLPEEFTLGCLQKTYQIVGAGAVNQADFKKSILFKKMIKPGKGLKYQARDSYKIKNNKLKMVCKIV